MRELPILMTAESAQAILDGRKSMTRRVIKPQPPIQWDKCEPVKNSNESVISWDFYNSDDRLDHGYLKTKCPYGQPGDRLWVRETWGNWSYDNPDSNAIYFQYRADYPDGAKTYMYDGNECDLPKWRPSIYMPKAAARIWLEVVSVRVERLNEITEEDSVKEGLYPGYQLSGPKGSRASTAKQAFMWLWKFLNTKRGYDWCTNPWVWVIEFKRVEGKN